MNDLRYLILLVKMFEPELHDDLQDSRKMPRIAGTTRHLVEKDFGKGTGAAIRAL